MNLSEQEIQLLEKYRNLLPEFQSLAEKRLDELFELQTEVVKIGVFGCEK